MRENAVFEVKKAPIPPEEERSVLSGKTGERSVVEDFFEQKRPFLEWYAGDSSIRMRSSEGVVLPDGQPLDTFAIDLEEGVMYGHPKFFAGELGYTEDKALFAYLHEFEHFRELRRLLQEKEGRAVWQKHQQKIADKKRYHILDNCFDDVKMNRTVASRVPTLAETRKKLYTENLFPDADLTGLPKHLQFAYILNCEHQEAGKQWQVAPDVREAMTGLEALRGKSGASFIEYASSPHTPMSVRLRLQETIIEPLYDRFFEEDVAKKKEDAKSGNKPETKGKENKGGETGGEKGKSQSEGGPAEKEKGEEGGQKGDGSAQDRSAADEPSGELSGEPGPSGKAEPQKGAEGKLEHPEDFFRDMYDEFFRRHPQAIPKDRIHEAVGKEIKRQEDLEAGKERSRIGENALEAYARAQGVGVNDLKQYRNFVARIEDIVNPESGEKAIEELRSVFRRIITERKKRVPAPQYPLAEGDILSYPAEAVVRTRAGEQEPDVWEDIETKERQDKEIGNFDVIIVGDVSGSMRQGGKAEEQRLAIVLLLEALREFAEDLDIMRAELREDLDVRTAGWVFGSRAECLKPLSSELTEKERVGMYKRLNQPDGDSTCDYLVLEQLLAQLTDEEIDALQSGKLKKLIIVMSDGESQDADRVGRSLKKLRENGAAVVGVGITNAGAAIIETYAPEARICKKASDLALTLAELLKEHLADV
jgi:hypothetical protein